MTVSKSAPVITVLLPVYNAQLYVREAVQSILSQSFQDFELIAIDDGSTDASGKILSELKSLDARIVLISRENRGIVDTLNEGLALARGRWIARMDADDISMLTRFEKQLSCLKDTGADMCGSWVQHFGTADKRVIKHPQSDAAIKMGLLFGSSFAHPSVMIRASLLRTQKYDKAWDKCEDYELWERAAAAGWKMANVPEVLLLYRQHNTQISKITAYVQQEMTQKVRCRFWRRCCEEKGLNPTCVDSILAMRQSPPGVLDMELVNATFTHMLRLNGGEARGVFFDHITRLYVRVAANYPDVVSKWSKLNSEFGSNGGFLTKLMLIGVARLHIHASGDLFQNLKKVFFLLRWRR